MTLAASSWDNPKKCSPGAGCASIREWKRVDAPARRRRMLFDGTDTIAAFVSSVSDIDDLIPCLTAYQIEWNKLHRRLVGTQVGHELAEGKIKASAAGDSLRSALGLPDEDLARLQAAWGAKWDACWAAVGTRLLDLHINSLASGFNDYRRAVDKWWDGLLASTTGDALLSRPIYFVSSNPHSLTNPLSGYALAHRAELIDLAQNGREEGLAEEWERLQGEDAGSADGEGPRVNFLYYMLRSFLRGNRERQVAWHKAEAEVGITRFDEPATLDISAQVIEMSELRPECLDPRLRMKGLDLLRLSNAVIVNVDYPLGFAAYHLLSQVASSAADLLGIYIMGKAATLNGRVGDVMIPNVVYDEHSRNTFLFKNCFLAQDLAQTLRYGTVFDNQKAVTVRGTFLQNRDFMSVFYKEGYTDLEMESGPYLSAVYEDIYPQRYPVNEIVNLFINAPYDIGLLHYASDTPYSRRSSLLSKSLSYFGVDATYACSIAILRRILQVEVMRVMKG